MNTTRCPVIDEANILKAREILGMLSEYAGEDIQSELLKELESCQTGGSRRSMKQRGGDRKQNIKRFIYVLISLLAGNAAISATAINTILPGIMMIVNGQCGMLGNMAWRIVGLENPVCSVWNTLAQRITLALTGDAASLALLTGAVGAVAATPQMIDAIVDQIATRIEGVLAGTIGVSNASKPSITNRRGGPNNNEDPGSAAATGGTRKTRRSRSRKTRRTRKH